jgi:hypothetical protein
MLLLLSSIACLAGLAGVYLRLRREFSRGIVFIAVALLAGATPLAYYTLFEPAPVDVAMFAAAAWLGVLVVSPIAARVWWVRVVAWIGIALLLVAHWPPMLWPSRWLDVLFSSWHGFLSWTPVAYAAVIGTCGYVRRNRAWALGTLALLFASAFIVGARESWPVDPAFAPRRMTPLLAVLAPGLAYLLDVLRRRPVLALAPLVIFPLVWNYLLMVQYTVGLLPKDEPVSFARLVRQQPDAYVTTSRFYPFAFPANVWFAWREGVPVDRYDVLALEPRRNDLDLAMDRKAARFLLDGWEAPGMDGSTPVWWLRGREAVMALPLALPADKPIEIVVRARSRFEEPIVQSDLTLQVNGRSVGDFSPAASTASEARFVVPPGQTVWRDGINRIAFVSRVTHRVDPSDPRPPGPLARRGGRPAWPVAIYRISIRPL